MLNVRKISLDSERRVIIVSDIHGNLPLFKRLLECIHYSSADYLFINGDLCEKGTNSLEVVRYIKRMEEQSSRVYVTKGNCDVLFHYAFEGNKNVFSYMEKRKHSILNEMLVERHKTAANFATVDELGQFFKTEYSDELNWLESLPLAFETEAFIVVHAGLEHRSDWQASSEEVALSLPSFLDNGHQASQMVIVGHWPVVNYRYNEACSNNPIIDREKRIISIDGGNEIKSDGQLNALIYEKGHYSFQFVDKLTEEKQVKKSYHDNSKRLGTVTYPNYEMKPLQREEHFTLCENKNLHIQQWIKNEYLLENPDGTICCRDDLSTTFLSVSKDETVKIIDSKHSGYVLVKRDDGLVGWIPQDVL